MADDVLPKDEKTLPTETAHTTPTTTREEARRALSGLDEKPQVHEITSQDRRIAEKELSQSELPSYAEEKKPTHIPVAPPIPPAPKPKSFTPPPREIKPEIPVRRSYAPRPTPPPPPVQRSAPAPTPPSPQGMRTLKQDVALAIENKTISLADIALSQERAAEALAGQDVFKPAKPALSISPKAIIAGAILLFVIGGGAALYISFRPSPSGVVPIDKTAKNFLIRPDVAYAISVGQEKKNLAETFKAALAQNATDGAIGGFSITVLDAEKKEVPLSAQEALANLFPNVSVQMSNSLGTEYMLGRFAAASSVTGFLALKVSSYEGAFAAMQSLEPNTALMWAKILNPNQTPTNEEVFWQDVFIRNTDARILTDTSGTLYFAYTFLSRDTLLITENKDAFIALVARYTTP